MNLSQLRSELILLLGNRSTQIIPESRYNLWLNNAQIEIASAFQFFQTEKQARRNTVIGSHSYQLPSDCLAVYALSDYTNHKKLKRTHYRKIDNINYTSTAASPSNYIRFGRSIQIYPTPSAVLTMYLRYCTTITTLSSDTDVPTIPQPWHEAILFGAEARGWRALGEMKKAMAVKDEFISMVRSRAGEWEIEESDEEFGLESVR